ncbi:MAG: 50S ribosomal protein L22 [Candidatus Altiarchaeota archaeon]
MEIDYAYIPKEEKVKIARAMGRDLDISLKNAVIVCERIKGMELQKAKNLLSDVISLKRAIPFRRFKKNIAHKKGLGKDAIAKYPKKAAFEILKILNNLEKNSEYKGLNTEKLKIINAVTLKGISRVKRKPKGRYQRRVSQLVNIQITAKEA